MPIRVLSLIDGGAIIDFTSCHKASCDVTHKSVISGEDLRSLRDQILALPDSAFKPPKKRTKHFGAGRIADVESGDSIRDESKN